MKRRENVDKLVEKEQNQQEMGNHPTKEKGVGRHVSQHDLSQKQVTKWLPDAFAINELEVRKQEFQQFGGYYLFRKTQSDRIPDQLTNPRSETNVPGEIVCEIAKYVSGKDVARMLQVCKFWRSHLLSGHLKFLESKYGKPLEDDLAILMKQCNITDISNFNWMNYYLQLSTAEYNLKQKTFLPRIINIHNFKDCTILGTYREFVVAQRYYQPKRKEMPKLNVELWNNQTLVCQQTFQRTHYCGIIKHDLVVLQHQSKLLLWNCQSEVSTFETPVTHLFHVGSQCLIFLRKDSIKMENLTGTQTSVQLLGVWDNTPSGIVQGSILLLYSSTKVAVVNLNTVLTSNVDTQLNYITLDEPEFRITKCQFINSTTFACIINDTHLPKIAAFSIAPSQDHFEMLPATSNPNLMWSRQSAVMTVAALFQQQADLSKPRVRLQPTGVHGQGAIWDSSTLLQVYTSKYFPFFLHTWNQNHGVTNDMSLFGENVLASVHSKSIPQLSADRTKLFCIEGSNQIVVFDLLNEEPALDCPHLYAPVYHYWDNYSRQCRNQPCTADMKKDWVLCLSCGGSWCTLHHVEHLAEYSDHLITCQDEGQKVAIKCSACNKKIRPNYFPQCALLIRTLKRLAVQERLNFDVPEYVLSLKVDVPDIYQTVSHNK